MSLGPMNKDEFDFISKRATEQLKMFDSDQSVCHWCGALLPRDRAFAEFHMLDVHGIVC